MPILCQISAKRNLVLQLRTMPSAVREAKTSDERKVLLFVLTLQNQRDGNISPCETSQEQCDISRQMNPFNTRERKGTRRFWKDPKGRLSPYLVGKLCVLCTIDNMTKFCISFLVAIAELASSFLTLCCLVRGTPPGMKGRRSKPHLSRSKRACCCLNSWCVEQDTTVILRGT